jgi:hypothetical protein
LRWGAGSSILAIFLGSRHRGKRMLGTRRCGPTCSTSSCLADVVCCTSCPVIALQAADARS